MLSDDTGIIFFDTHSMLGGTYKIADGIIHEQRTFSEINH